MSFLLDTNVVSELRKARKAHPRVLTWRASVDLRDAFLSVIVLGEILRGITLLRRRDLPQAAMLEHWFQDLRREFDGRILPIDEPTAMVWAGVALDKVIPAPDALVAATALQHGLTVVTRNTRHFAMTGVPVLNPFD